jgi:hypothetical protein
MFRLFSLTLSWLGCLIEMVIEKIWKCELTKGNLLIVAKGNMISVLYHVYAKLCATFVNALQKEDTCALWHKRLGHMSKKGISVLVKKKLLKVYT